MVCILIKTIRSLKYLKKAGVFVNEVQRLEQQYDGILRQLSGLRRWLESDMCNEAPEAPEVPEDLDAYGLTLGLAVLHYKYEQTLDWERMLGTDWQRIPCEYCSEKCGYFVGLQDMEAYFRAVESGRFEEEEESPDFSIEDYNMQWDTIVRKILCERCFK